LKTKISIRHDSHPAPTILLCFYHRTFHHAILTLFRYFNTDALFANDNWQYFAHFFLVSQFKVNEAWLTVANCTEFYQLSLPIFESYFHRLFVLVMTNALQKYMYAYIWGRQQQLKWSDSIRQQSRPIPISFRQSASK